MANKGRIALLEKLKADLPSDKLENVDIILDWFDKNPSKDLIQKVFKLDTMACQYWNVCVTTFSNFDESYEQFRLNYIIKHWNEA